MKPLFYSLIALITILIVFKQTQSAFIKVILIYKGFRIYLFRSEDVLNPLIQLLEIPY